MQIVLLHCYQAVQNFDGGNILMDKQEKKFNEYNFDDYDLVVEKVVEQSIII